jgi:hypothetical protein
MSTSGHTFIQYYTYTSGTCGISANCNFRGVIHPKSGYDQAEVFLTGFSLKRQTGVDKVQTVAAEVHKFNYDSATGDMEVGVTGSIQAGQPYSYEISFVVLQASNAVARFTHAGNGCSGVAECHIAPSLSGSIPSGMHYIGLGTRMFHLGTDSAGPINVNAISMEARNIVINSSVMPGDVSVDYTCTFRDASAQKKMFCEWDASVIAFDPAEMDRNDSAIFPQYTMGARGVSVSQQLTGRANPFSGGTIAGYFDALEGLSLFYDPGQENPIWMVNASAFDFNLIGSPATSGQTSYGIFMGTTFADEVKAQPYTYQMSRAIGLLK